MIDQSETPGYCPAGWYAVPHRPSLLGYAGPGIVAAVGVWMFWGSALSIRDAMEHEGPGIVTYGTAKPNRDGDTGGEREEVVSEAEYKRHEYAESALGMAFGAGAIVLTGYLWRAHKKSYFLC